MNDQMQQFARQTLKNNLARCTEGQQGRFKQMYGFKIRNLPVDVIVDRMPADKLDRAMEQVQRTVDKNATESAEKCG